MYEGLGREVRDGGVLAEGDEGDGGATQEALVDRIVGEGWG